MKKSAKKLENKSQVYNAVKITDKNRENIKQIKRLMLEGTLMMMDYKIV